MNKSTASLMFLGCACIALTSAMAQPPAEAPAWRQSRETNKADAYTYTRFTLVGRYTAGHAPSENRPALAIDCIPAANSDGSKGTYLAANLRAGSALKIIYVEPWEIHGTSYFPKVAVQYQAGDAGNVEKDTWSPGGDLRSVSVPRSALKSFLRSRAVDIHAQDDLGTQIAMRFEIPDPTPVADGCNLDVR